MADQTSGRGPGNDPLGDRLRSTFAAEHADIDRRNLAPGDSAVSGRSVRWLPLAVAAGLAVIAGFFFISNRSNDQAVELDVAAQPAPDTSPTPEDGATQPAEPAGTPDAETGIPFQTGVNMCGDSYDPRRTVIWNVEGTVGWPVSAFLKPGVDEGVLATRKPPTGWRAALAGGCTSATTSEGSSTWYELVGEPGQPNDWVRVDYLITPAEASRQTVDAAAEELPPTPPVNGCGELPLVFPFRFIWDIASNDPDGGLVAHTLPGIDEPVTRIIQLDEVVVVTGECELSNTGSKWYELRDVTGSVDWVSGRYLLEPFAACLSGEQFGTRTRNNDQLIYNVVGGDTIGLIATRFGIALEELLAANPSVDPTALAINQPVWIPGLVPEPEQIFGPLDGLAVGGTGDRVAFAPNGSTRYRWYPADAIRVGDQCYAEGEPGPVCLQGEVRLIDPQSPEPIWTGTGPLDADATGRTLPRDTISDGWIEVTIDAAGGRTGLIDPLQTGIERAACVDAPSTLDSFAAVPCNATDSETTVGSAARGSASSEADHVHNIRVAQGASSAGPCTRIVIEFGQGLTTDGADSAAELLPVLTIEKDTMSTRLLLPPTTVSNVAEPTRVDFPQGVALLAFTEAFEPSVEILYQQSGPVNVWFLENPARAIVDYLNPPPSPSTREVGPFGQEFVVREPIQTDMFGPGIPVGSPIIVRGFGRPFEAQGEYRVYRVEPDADALASVQNGDPFFSDILRTSGWADGWGSFAVELPPLEPGTYVAIFGELPPTDEIGFYGAGQLFRVFDPAEPAADSYPPAVLLPDVQLDPEQ